jgi:hypothetical protein
MSCLRVGPYRQNPEQEESHQDPRHAKRDKDRSGTMTQSAEWMQSVANGARLVHVSGSLALICTADMRAADSASADSRRNGGHGLTDRKLRCSSKRVKKNGGRD